MLQPHTIETMRLVSNIRDNDIGFKYFSKNKLCSKCLVLCFSKLPGQSHFQNSLLRMTLIIVKLKWFAMISLKLITKVNYKNFTIEGTMYGHGLIVCDESW